MQVAEESKFNMTTKTPPGVFWKSLPRCLEEENRLKVLTVILRAGLIYIIYILYNLFQYIP